MRILVIRIAAIGDMIGITPLLRYLKQQNNEIYVLTKQTGMEILANNPNVDKLILYSDEIHRLFPNEEDIPNNEIGKFFNSVGKIYECENIIDLCESWEVKLARHPSEPSFKYTKQWAEKNCDTNYYEQIFKLANINPDFNKNMLPEMFFTEKEEAEMNNMFVDFRKKGKKIIMWGLSGSAANKTYPFIPDVIFDILKKHLDICFLTVGDEVCQILEQELKNERIINKSGSWTIRQSCLATKYSDLLIAPDTGILHASGMYETPKIGILNHTSRNNITKHFKNDYSICANNGSHSFFGPITCSPCYKIHYSKKITCNMMKLRYTEVPICMGAGIPAKKLIERIEGVLNAK